MRQVFVARSVDRKEFRYTLIPAAEREPIVMGTVLMDASPDPDHIRESVSELMDVAFPQRVPLPTPTGTKDMFWNSMAEMTNLKVNHRATRLYHQHHLDMHPEAKRSDLLRLRGPVILFDEPVWS
jgi:hypothetical protein